MYPLGSRKLIPLGPSGRGARIVAKAICARYGSSGAPRVSPITRLRKNDQANRIDSARPSLDETPLMVMLSETENTIRRSPSETVAKSSTS